MHRSVRSKPALPSQESKFSSPAAIELPTRFSPAWAGQAAVSPVRMLNPDIIIGSDPVCSRLNQYRIYRKDANNQYNKKDRRFYLIHSRTFLSAAPSDHSRSEMDSMEQSSTR
jgi:hypothetical protein